MTDELEDQLRVGGAKVSEGVFRVDSKRALSKLREYRLAEPHHWVLEVLRAASSAKATSVDIETDTDDIIIRFDGKEFPPAVMKDLLARALDSTGQGDRRSARYLSLGIAGALGLEPKWIKVRSSHVALEIRPPDVVTLSASKEKGTLVHVRKRFGWAVVKAALADVTPEELAVVDRAKRYGPKLTHNKKELGGDDLFKGGFIVSSTFEGAGMEVTVGVPANAWGGVVVFDIDGVIVARRTMDLPGKFIVAWARCDRMRRNASGSDVVDSDEAVVAVMAKIRSLALEVTQKMGAHIAQGRPHEAWRERYRGLALELMRDVKANADVLPLLARFPLIPGLHGAWFTPDDFALEQREGRPIYYALETFPRGSYPVPMAVLESITSDPIAKLLPAKQRVDAAKIVRAKARAAEAKDRWLGSPVEEATAPFDRYVTRAAITGPSLAGEVGMLEQEHAGAFVRFLCQGRFVQQGDVSTLAPFRLRAVIDYQKDVPEKLWAEIPSDKIWSLALDAIKDAAERAVLSGLSSSQQPRFASHALDLLARRANAGGSIAKLPAALRAAPIFQLTGGAWTSLDQLEQHATWRYVGERTNETLLSGDPVLILTAELREALNKLAPKRLVNARARLDQEREIRDRLSGSRKAPKLRGIHVLVDLEGDGFTGQVGIPAVADTVLGLTLLRDGVPIEKTSLTPAYGLAQAIVDCKTFAPNDDWDTVVRDKTFDRALSAVRAAEHRLAGALLDQAYASIDLMAAGHAQFLAAFMRKHLKSGEARNPEAERVDNAALFRVRGGLVSLATLRAAATADKRLWTLPIDSDRLPPAGMLVVNLKPEHAALVGQLIDERLEDATAELDRMERRARHLALPHADLELEDHVELQGSVSAARVTGRAGLAAASDRSAAIDVIVEERLFRVEFFASNLPLRGIFVVEGVDPADTELPDDARGCVTIALRLAEQELIERAIADPSAPGARRLICLALQQRLDRALASRIIGEALADLKFFPCTDGQTRSARELDTRKKLLFVTTPVHGAPVSKEPVVIAVDEHVRSALIRWPVIEDVSSSLKHELDARAARMAIKQVETIALGGKPLWKRQLHEADLEGEIGIVSADAGRLELLYERRPVSVVSGALPGPLAAVVNSNTLTLAPFDKGIVHDAAYKAVVERLMVEAELLLDRVADALFIASEDERKRLAPLLAPLALWLVSRKKRSARLVKLPLLLTTEGEPLSLLEIFEDQKLHKTVLWSDEAGPPLSKARWVWRPRAGERQLLDDAKVRLKDATSSIRKAAEVSTRRKVSELKVATDGPRETIATDRLQGEVGLGAIPSKALVIEIYREHALLERFSAEHPVGAVAKINCDALTPNGDWTKASRNKTFKALVTEVEDAVERLVALRLSSRGESRAYAEAAARWKRAPGGPLAKALPPLALFTSLDGAAITVGAAMEEHSRSGRILVAEPGLPPPRDRLVLEKSEGTLELLKVLGLQTEDTSGLLKRAGELEAGLQARRLVTLKYHGDPIARLALASDGLRGELVIVDEDENPEVVLAKDGIRVCTHVLGKLPVAGVVNVDGLEVNEDWTTAVVTRELRSKLEEATELLFTSLARTAPDLSGDDRARARTAALAFLASSGISSSAHLDRMTGAAAALAAAPLFLSEDGAWVPLRAIADQILRTGWISIFEKAWRKRDTLQELVLRADTLRDPWISGLENLVGASCVERVKDVDLWRKQLAERDPAPGTPEGEGLKRLRKEMRLLRAGALGHVTPDELDDLRVRSDGATQPIAYDPKRKLVLLDGTNPLIARALEEIPRRPERIYILLAAIYGSVNRALARVTDDDEAELLLALAAHVAANPKCLGPPESD